jgi:hypothetical protein
MAEIRVFIEAWRGIRDLRAEMRAGRIRVTGHSQLRRQLPDWLRLSSLASYPRRRAGAEKRRCENRERVAATAPT